MAKISALNFLAFSFNNVMWLSWHVGKGKLNQILQRDWLSERATLGYPARSGFPTVSRKKMVFFLPHESKLVWSRWLDIEIVPFERFEHRPGKRDLD